MTDTRGFRPVHFLFGLLMGAADVVPGISGGTVALILGIYERLIGSIQAVAMSAGHVVRGRVAIARATLGEVEWGLVLPLGAGIVTALVLGARIIEPLIETYPAQVRALFFGLIAGSLRIPWRAVRKPDRSHLPLASAAAVLAFLFSGLPPREVIDPPLLTVFLAAMIAICAMILPGVSGAFLLLVMGMYAPSLAALNDRDFTYIVVFVLGALIGLGAFSRVLSWLLTRYHDVTMAALVGLMAGSLRALWPWQDAERGLLAPPSGASLGVAVLLAGVGFAVVNLVVWLGHRVAKAKAGTAAKRRSAKGEGAKER